MAYGLMSDRVKLAREIAARTEPRFIARMPRCSGLDGGQREGKRNWLDSLAGFKV